MEKVELTALALAPVVFLFTYVYLSDKYEREPLIYLVISFFLGVLAAYPVLKFSPYLQEFTGFYNNPDSVVELLLHAFILVALMEEGMKFLVLRFYNYPHKEFDEPYDGIMYGVAVSLGFAAIENMLYVFGAGSDAFDIGLMRMFTAVPAHAMFGVLMGFFVGKAKFVSDKGEKTRLIALGLFSATFFHGTYNFLLFLQSEYLTIFAFIALAVGIILAKAAMHTHAEHSPHKYSNFKKSDSDKSNKGPFVD